MPNVHPFPKEFWDKVPELRDVYRKIFPDPRKIPLDERRVGADPEDRDDLEDEKSADEEGPVEGIAEGELECHDEELEPADPNAKDDYWEK